VVTLPSHINILTGRLPTEHGVRDNAGFRLPVGIDTLATILKSRGYRTGAFVSAFPLESRFGLTRGFDVYDDRFAGAGPRPAFLVQERRGDETVRLAQQWLDQAAGGPWFCWIHLYEPHYPYEPSERFAARWPGEPYLGDVAAADAALAPLLAPVLDAGTNGRTLIVLTSDHGESLGEHGEATHGIFAYESVLRVPLVVHAPRLVQPRVVEGTARHVDVLPTVLDALDSPVPDGLAGRSLWPAIAGRSSDADIPTYFEALSGSLSRGWAPLVGILDGALKYIDLPIPELYDVRSDPQEARNLAASDAATVARLREQLDRFRTPLPIVPADETADVRRRLRSLGYVAGGGGRSPETYTKEDDPKRLIGLDAKLQTVVDRYLSGDLPGALAEARDLVRRRPSMGIAWMQLGHLERDAGNLDRAIDAMSRAVTLNAGDTEPLALLGAYLTEAGRAREAADLLEPAAEQPAADLDVLTARALALSRLQRFDDALALLGRARERHPSHAMLLVHVGTVHLTRGDRTAAREAFEEAARVSPDLARAHSSLAAMAVEEERFETAVQHWTRAASLDPGEYGRILALGIALARQGRHGPARACLEFFTARAPRERYGPDLDRARAWLNAGR
jgi:arylsulfatase A-like enzyme/tetratricopeptide (TPR) repeat protein